MGKKDKEHRKKVAKRNERLKQQKSTMQKTFDTLLQQQMEKMKEEQELKVQAGDQEINYEVIEDEVVEQAFKFTPNEKESEKINKEFEPEYDSAGFTIEDIELPTDE